MPKISTIPATPIGGDRDTMADEIAGKRQVNYYIDRENDLAMRQDVFDRKQFDLTFSNSRLTNDALRMYFLVRRMQKEYRDSSDPYEAVRESITVHYTGKRKVK